MKLTKESSISIGLLVVLIPGFLWFFNKVEEKADKAEVKEIEEIAEEAEDINIKQSIYIEQIQQNQLKFIDEFKELQQAK